MGNHEVCNSFLVTLMMYRACNDEGVKCPEIHVGYERRAVPQLNLVSLLPNAVRRPFGDLASLSFGSSIDNENLHGLLRSAEVFPQVVFVVQAVDFHAFEVATGDHTEDLSLLNNRQMTEATVTHLA